MSYHRLVGPVLVWEQLLQDLRYALRMMAGQPLFTAMATLSLALGIGANTAIYSFLDAILLRSLPVRDPGSLVVVNWRSKDRPPVIRALNGTNFRDPKTGYTSGNFPYRGFETLRSQSRVLSSLFAFKSTGRLNLMIRGQAEPGDAEYISSNYFSGLGVPAAAGRLIEADDDRASAPPVAVLAFGYAQRRFGDVQAAVGQPILINNVPFTVAGVAAPEFFGVNAQGSRDLYLPMHASLLLDTPDRGTPDVNRKYVDDTYYWADVMGRLRPGVSREQAEAELAPLFRHFVEETAKTDKERADMPVLYLAPGAGGLDFLRREYSRPLYVLMTMVGLILAIACANLANLLLARATGRRREIGVRLSLGAGRSRIVRQLLTESVLLGALGGLAGLAVAQWGIGALTALIGNGRENFTLRATLNWNVLGVTVALSIGAGILFGLVPALQAARVDLNTALKATRAGEARLRSWLRVSAYQTLVVAQITVSMLLLVAAGLFVRTLNNLNAVTLGFNGERVLVFSVNARQAGYRDRRLVQFYEDLRTRVAAIPGVLHVTLSDFTLVSGSSSQNSVQVPGFTGANQVTSSMNVGPGFFTAMQTPILAGREIDERDVREGASVAVVNEVFAKTYFRNESPIGKRFRWGGTANGVDLEIIGVSRTARYSSLKREIPPVTYKPYSVGSGGLSRMSFEVRTAAEPLSFARAVRQAVQQADARVPVMDLGTQQGRINETISQERVFATLCVGFAALAIVIACVGLYGMMAYSVARRTNEIGIRMALGAERRRVVWMVLREVLVMAVVGLAIGLPAALGTSRVLESFLFQMKPNDPMTLTVASVALLTAAVAAGYGPARRASRVDPWTALRDE